LYQNVLYERLSPARRLQLHRRIAERGEEIYGDRSREIAAELAMHFERGANFTQAIKFLGQAADNAIRRFAYQEAVGLSRQGLELLDRLPDSPERIEQELCLQLTLGVPLIATQGYAWPDVGKIYLRARELCQQLGATPDISEVLWGLWTFYTLRAEFGTAREIAEEFLLLAERHPYPGLELRGQWALLITCMHLGEFESAMKHFEKALVVYDPERHREDAFLYAQNPGVAMRCFAAWSLWVLGQPDRGVEQVNESLMLARELSEPHGLAHALFFAAALHQLRREGRIALELAEEAIAVSVEHGLELYRAMATIIRGWALIEQAKQVGTVEETMKDELIHQISLGIADHRATGAEVLCPHFLALQVEALTGRAKTEELLNLLEEGLSTAHRTGEKFYQAELYRIKGEVLFTKAMGMRDEGLSLAATGGGAVQETSSGIASEAEVCFHQAVTIAAQQHAKAWELRATMSLARFYKERNRREEARKLIEALSRLSQIYDQFSDGLQTADLREARDLLSRSGGSEPPYLTA
jgi:tetratricopeptide (TPR) repeat protein